MTRLSFAAGAATSFELVQSAQALRQAELALAAREFELAGARFGPWWRRRRAHPLSAGARLLAGGDRAWLPAGTAGPAAARPRRPRPSRWRSRPWRPGRWRRLRNTSGTLVSRRSVHAAAPGVGLRARDPGQPGQKVKARQSLLRIDARQEAAVLAQTQRRPGPGRDPAAAGHQHPARASRPLFQRGHPQPAGPGQRHRRGAGGAGHVQAARANVRAQTRAGGATTTWWRRLPGGWATSW